MKRINRKKYRLIYRLKIYKDNKRILFIKRQVKNKIVETIQGNSGDKWYIYVGYGKDENDEEMCNEGIYKTKKDTLEALNCFTEAPLLDFIEKGTNV